MPVNQSQSVKVAKDGSGNFTTVGDAVAFAPNNTAIEDGYFAIYIEEGVYSENVVVPKNKKNLILIGVGINRTIITSNRSVVDGWTTFASATFGERACSCSNSDARHVRLLNVRYFGERSGAR